IPFFFPPSEPARTAPLSLPDALPIFDRYDRVAAAEVSKVVRSTLSRDVVLPQILEVYEDAIADMAADGVADVVVRKAVAEYLRRSEEHTSELQSLRHLVCRLLLEKKK